jgi:hypothetical protein
LHGQLTTGVIEGLLRAPDGRPLSDAPVKITGGAGFETTIRTNPRGEFTLTLPYGRYQVAGVAVRVAPFATTHIEFESGTARILPEAGIWRDSTRGRTYPDAISVPGTLLGREPSSVTDPPDFLGSSDNRLAVTSQRAISWTATQYQLQGIDVTDSYQPGRPIFLPDIGALDEMVVQSASVGLFLAEPGGQWHGALSSTGTGAPLAGSNLPPPASRGAVQQAERFQWLTRDSLEAGGPLAKSADLFAAATGQWASETVPLAAPGNNRGSRLLFSTARGRVRAGARDQLEGVYTGSAIGLSDWGLPAGMETLAANRIAPSLITWNGFKGESETDRFDTVQAGWTHHAAGILEVRYAYSVARLETRTGAAGASRIDLVSGAVTGAPPLANLARRPRHSLRAAWQPQVRRHRIAVGGGWDIASPGNRLVAPSNGYQVTANGVPAFVVAFNPPAETRAGIHSFSGFAADRISVAHGLSLDVGALVDVSRGAVQDRPGNLIAWNSLSPRVGLAWAVPRAHGLILRGGYSRLYEPLAGRYLDFGDPNSLGGIEYQWNDLNTGGLPQPAKQGPLVMRFGGPYSSIAPSLGRPYADEFNTGAEMALGSRLSGGIRLFRRDEKSRIAAVNTGVPAQAFSPVAILDPGPDGSAGTFDDQTLTVYQQNPATFGQDRYLLTNPSGLRTLNEGVVAEMGARLGGLNLHASFAAEKSWGPANPGDAVYENDPGVLGALFLDPNTGIHAAGRSFVDRAYVGKVQGVYRLPWGLEMAGTANYMDGLPFARQILVTGLAQGPFLAAATMRGSPQGGNRAEYVFNWNLRIAREFRLPFGTLGAVADILNVTNAGKRIQESDASGPLFNLRLPVAIQAPRTVRLGLRYEF